MNHIAQIDRNFAVPTSLNLNNVRFYDVQDQPFSIYGVFYENGCYRRMPEQIANTVSEAVTNLHVHTAGGRVKFITDSCYVAIKAVMPVISRMPHFALTGTAGFDLYVGKKEQYYGTFIPRFEKEDEYESVLRFEGRKQREITINFPLYSGVSALYIGLEEDALLKKAPGYKYQAPIVCYGSSITQGGCASRPGNAYESILSRTLHADHINLGFSGSAKGEEAMAQYISTLDMSVFIYDYDYNAPTPQHLRQTHQKMFQIIRAQQPNLPILILSRPRYQLVGHEEERLSIIRKTYEDAIASGDRNVYFIEGPTLMHYAQDGGTVDNVHPNDLGFFSMAKMIIKILKPILALS